MYTLEYLLWRI